MSNKMKPEERAKHLEPVSDLITNIGTDSKRFRERIVPLQSYPKRSARQTSVKPKTTKDSSEKIYFKVAPSSKVDRLEGIEHP